MFDFDYYPEAHVALYTAEGWATFPSLDAATRYAQTCGNEITRAAYREGVLA